MNICIDHPNNRLLMSGFMCNKNNTFILLQHLFYFIAYETTPLIHHYTRKLLSEVTWSYMYVSLAFFSLLGVHIN